MALWLTLKRFCAKCRLNTQSNTTRIETYFFPDINKYRGTSLNTQSNTTRIETPRGRWWRRSSRRVWIPNPIQQGLKQIRTAARTSLSAGLNTQSNTTRIETFGGIGIGLLTQQVWIPNPIQQGLKPTLATFNPKPPFGLNTQSNTTRIETDFSVQPQLQQRRLNTQSNTTRIETNYFLASEQCSIRVWIPNPIQQGLKPKRRSTQLQPSRRFEYPIQYNKDWNKIL